MSSLHIAVKNGSDASLVTALLSGAPNPSVWNEDGYTSDEDTFSILLFMSFFRETPLDFCYKFGQLQLVDTLINAGAMKFTDIQSFAATAIQAAYRGWKYVFYRQINALLVVLSTVTCQGSTRIKRRSKISESSSKNSVVL